MNTAPDIFLSYNREDQAIARRFADAFAAQGFNVWWDATLRSGDAYDQITEKALKSAKAVVVLWSTRSVESRWVRAEATLADRNKTLVPVMIELCERPIMFELTQTADLCHWQGAHDDKVWLAFVADVHQFVGKTKDKFPAATNAPGTVSTVSTPIERLPSIAVLPFANLSGDKEQEYFSDGLAEEIINALAQLPGLKVIARTSAFAFKGQNTDIRRIAETLGVANILEGSVRRSGNRIRVTAQLIAASDGTHMWSERFDRELADVFAVQDEISAAISAALKIKLAPVADAKPRYTPNLQAYEALLKARHFHWKVTFESMKQAQGFYQQAIALDPHYALAYSDYASYLFGRAVVGLSPLHEIAADCRALTQKALELEPSLADAHGCLCCLAAQDYDWQEAEREFRLATPGGKGSPVGHMGCGWSYLMASGQLDRAVQSLRLAVQGDPLHLTHRAILAWCLNAAGQHAEAEELLQQSKVIDPGFFWTHYYLAELYIAHQRFAEALAAAEQAYALAPEYLASAGLYAGLLVRTGQPERGNAVMATLGDGQTHGAAKAFAIFHTVCGKIDLAADWYEKAIAERDPMVAPFLQGTIGVQLRDSARWPKLAALMNLSV
jgi:TolB-like protein